MHARKVGRIHCQTRPWFKTTWGPRTSSAVGADLRLRRLPDVSSILPDTSPKKSLAHGTNQTTASHRICLTTPHRLLGSPDCARRPHWLGRKMPPRIGAFGLLPTSTCSSCTSVMDKPLQHQRWHNMVPKCSHPCNETRGSPHMQLRSPGPAQEGARARARAPETSSPLCRMVRGTRHSALHTTRHRHSGHTMKTRRNLRLARNPVGKCSAQGRELESALGEVQVEGSTWVLHRRHRRQLLHPCSW
mmetsp:Transcript_25936/g.52319  ORF Transcript_25936/g.52319 Transcript_25936/m.52319 type:complete len:246 (+) Transcript_25936:193-930(+)